VTTGSDQIARWAKAEVPADPPPQKRSTVNRRVYERPVIQPDQQFTDRLIQFRQVVKTTVP
jgi:hypothetical protein